VSEQFITAKGGCANVLSNTCSRA